ncbi:MAG: putative DNA modification/repair radical SAM protein [Spirochaetales bacterium]|nr:putative DNA modification/repair radical SAM protein [Spirochaetales bacterium]
MTLIEKVGLLAEGAKYDVSCSSSGSGRTNQPGGLGNSLPAGVCHSWASDGRCISLLKILLSNNCAWDCSYCRIRKSNDMPRTTLMPDELIELTLNLYRRNYIEGLFLSSAVLGDPDKTMELMLRVVKKLRQAHNFNGYIHLKAIPGAGEHLIREAGLYADRMSVNIELPTSESLKILAPQKERQAIIGPMKLLGNEYSQIQADQNSRLPSIRRSLPNFLPAGHTTQMIIGASPETDLHIVHLMENLYQKFNLKRVYYSAYVPVNDDNRLPALAMPPLKREHRLYQADWLLRFYKYKAYELLDETFPNLDDELDPKASWAVRNHEFFPLEINRASYEEILRVPGIGVTSALRIIKARRQVPLDFPNLKKMGVVLKRARFFILCKGKSMDYIQVGGPDLRIKLLSGLPVPDRQLRLF